MKTNVLLLRNSVGRVAVIPYERIVSIFEAFNNGDNSTWSISLDDGDVLVLYASRKDLAEQLGTEVEKLMQIEGFSPEQFGHVPPKVEKEEENSSENVPEIEES